MSYKIGVVKIIEVKWIVTSSTKTVEQSIEYFINRPSMEMHIYEGGKIMSRNHLGAFRYVV